MLCAGLFCPPLQEMAREDPVCAPESMGSEDMLFLLYTSGSTGTPKGLVHTQAGYLLYAALTHRVRASRRWGAGAAPSRRGSALGVGGHAGAGFRARAPAGKPRRVGVRCCFLPVTRVGSRPHSDAAPVSGLRGGIC